MSSKRGKARLVHLGDRRVVAAGLGPRDELEPDAVRDAAAAAVRELRATVGGSAAWLLDDSLALDPAEQVRAAVEGAVLGGYDPGAWKTGPATTQPVERLTIVGPDGLAEAASRAAVIAGVDQPRTRPRQRAAERADAGRARRAGRRARRRASTRSRPTALEPAEMRELRHGRDPRRRRREP